VLLVVITAAFGVAFYNADVPTGTLLLEYLIVVVVGAVSFAAVGMATTAIVPNADTAPPVLNALLLPPLFLSGIFIPFGVETPEWIKTVARIFPVKHFADAMRAAFYGPPQFEFLWRDVLIVAIWGGGGLILAVRFFSWEPRKWGGRRCGSCSWGWPFSGCWRGHVRRRTRSSRRPARP